MGKLNFSLIFPKKFQPTGAIDTFKGPLCHILPFHKSKYLKGRGEAGEVEKFTLLCVLIVCLPLNLMKPSEENVEIQNLNFRVKLKFIKTSGWAGEFTADWWHRCEELRRGKR